MRDGSPANPPPAVYRAPPAGSLQPVYRPHNSRKGQPGRSERSRIGTTSQNCQLVATHCDTVGCLHSYITVCSQSCLTFAQPPVSCRRKQAKETSFSSFCQLFWVFLEPSDWSSSLHVPCASQVANSILVGQTCSFHACRWSKGCSAASGNLFALVRPGSLLKHARLTINHVFQGIFFSQEPVLYLNRLGCRGRVSGPAQTCIRNICLDPVRTFLHTFHSNIR